MDHSATSSRVGLLDCGSVLVSDEHDTQHHYEDGEERTERNEDTFTEPFPSRGLKKAVFGANIGLREYFVYYEVVVVHFAFLYSGF